MKNLIFIAMCLVAGIQSCKKENSEIENQLSSKSNGFISNAREETYVTAINPFNDSIIGGNSFPITVVLNKPAPAGGFKAYVNTIRYTGPIVDVPSYVTIPEGQSTGTINVHSIPVRTYEIQLFLVGPAFSILDLQYLTSFLPRPENDPRQPIFLEAENAILKGAHAVSGNNAFFSNGAFVEYDKTNGGSVTFDFSVKKSGNYFLVIKYATPSEYNLEKNVLNVQLNEKAINENFPFTANETTTQILNTKQYLKKGNNKLTLTSIGKGTERLDYLEVAAE